MSEVEVLDKLSSPRQLSPFRKWPNGREGCLFYVPDVEDDENGRWGIYFLDSQVRKYDNMGEYNTLHKAEYKLLKDNCILHGYAAFLIQMGYFDHNRHRVMERWATYTKWCEKKNLGQRINQMELIAQECENWLKKDDAILEDFFRNEIKEEMLCLAANMKDTIREIVQSNMTSVEDMMWKMQPIIKPPIKDKSSGAFIYYDTDFEKMQFADHRRGWGLEGFQASLLNYLTTYYLFDKVASEQNVNRMVEWMCEGYHPSGNRGEHTIDFNDIDFEFDGLDIREVYNSYIRHRIEKVRMKLKGNAKYAYCSEEQQSEWALHELLKSEIKIYKAGNPFEQYMYELTIKNLKEATFRFMCSLLRQHEDSPYYENDRESLLNLDPSLKDVLAEELSESPKQKLDKQKIVPQHNDKLADAIMEVQNAGIICTKSDWAAVVKILEERHLVRKSDYHDIVQMINGICGNATSINSIARSTCMYKVKGIYPNWEIRNGEETRETPNKLKHYMSIASIFVSALDS